MRIRPWTSLAALAVALLTAVDARAYVRTRTSQGAAMHWNHACLGLLVYAESRPEELSRDSFVAAAKAAAETWSQQKVGCTALNLTVSLVEEPSALVEFDRRNRITFRNQSWCKEPRDPNTEPCYDRAALAITSVFARKPDGVILDSDMEINGVDFSWGDVSVGSASSPLQDVQNVLTHELGHLIGLDHTCWSDSPLTDHQGNVVPNCRQSPPQVAATTMFASARPGDITKRDLEPDDVAAVCAVYPKGAVPCAEPDEEGGCSVAPEPRARSRWGLAVGGVALLGLVMGLRRRRQRV